MSLPRVAIVGMGGYAGFHRRAVHQAVEGGRALHTAQVAPPADHEPFADELESMRAAGIAIYSSLREMLA
ncbi:MAG: gfo/Idh/MocA family oxidoreductase, partial [bacterium]|nr:gfo/Idh/MocA family oxidoreductase [bacterium]